LQKAVAVVTSLGLGQAVFAIHHIGVKRKAFDLARDLVTYKGIINLGCGPRSIFTPLAREIAESPEVVVNVDIVPDTDLTNLTLLDIETDHLPWFDKTFDCAFMSHILEHLDDWEYALNEAIRVADHVVVVLPYPLSPAGLFHPDHKQHFTLGDMKNIEETYPSVTVFC